jgi:hypothetical protein
VIVIGTTPGVSLTTIPWNVSTRGATISPAGQRLSVRPDQLTVHPLGSGSGDGKEFVSWLAALSEPNSIASTSNVSGAPGFDTITVRSALLGAPEADARIGFGRDAIP